MRGKSEDNWRVPSRKEDSRPREQHMQSHQTQERSISGTFWVFNVGMGEIRLGQPMQSPERSIRSSCFMPATLWRRSTQDRLTAGALNRAVPFPPSLHSGRNLSQSPSFQMVTAKGFVQTPGHRGFRVTSSHPPGEPSSPNTSP